jgi:ABC-type transport system substrate-binding protein
MPGHDPDNKGFAHDVEAAKKLLATAGHPEGFSTELYAMNVDPHPRIAQAIQQDLAAIGIKVEIKSLAQAEVIAAGGAGTAPMVWSGGMGWLTDFPDPAGFFGAILSCAGTQKAAGTGQSTATRTSTHGSPRLTAWSSRSRPKRGSPSGDRSSATS